MMTQVTDNQSESSTKIAKKKKKDIRKLSLEKLTEFFLEHNEKAFRAKQVYARIWKKSARSFDEITEISLKTRDLLKESFDFNAVTLHSEQQSNDGTIKVLFRLYDGNLVEGVLIPTSTRMTACISSQVGCSLACKFCATGYMDRKRNLEAGEIYDQVVLIGELAQKHFEKPLSNVVYMGMGEPLLNYANTLKSVHYLTSPEGLDMSPRRITVSTAGVAKMIRKLGDDDVKFNLALSLHAANDTKRNTIMEINETNSLEELREALKYYFSKTKNKITYEYIVLQGVNDSQRDAEELYKFTRHLPSKVNIIEYNPITEADFVNTSVDKFDHFVSYLERKKVLVNVRRSRGKDIDAACGQLAIKN